MSDLEDRAHALLVEKQDTIVEVPEGMSMTVAFLRAMGLDAAADECERIEREGKE